LIDASLPNPPGARAKRRIFLVDDHAILRNGLAEMINQSDDLVVCGEAASAEEALRQIQQEKPDLAIVDLSLPGQGGLDLLKTLKSRMPALALLVLSMHDEVFYAQRALQAGALGYIMKREAIEELQSAIRHILGGKVYLSAKMSERFVQGAIRGEGMRVDSPVERLSDRELEVLELIGTGLGVAEIAQKLHLSVKTIDTYKARLKQKLKVTKAAHLLQHALRLNTGTPGPNVPQGNSRSGTQESL
jgi:DNA-binding NarL/FixJ family response regulator